VIAQGSTEVFLSNERYLYDPFHYLLRVESITRELGMSASGFQHRFKAVTAMSPLQFQKRLRLRRHDDPLPSLAVRHESVAAIWLELAPR
jgi:AraC-like DNA-binding protein